MDQLAIDCIRLQKARGWQSNRNVLSNIKDDSKALEEAVELIRAIISECIDRSLPLDDAFVGLHFAVLAKKPVDYDSLIKQSNNANISAMKTDRGRKGMHLLRQIHEKYESNK